MKLIKGNIFDSDADAILHQVNCQGVMGSGVAKQVRERYPVVFAYYKNLCDRDKAERQKLGIAKSGLLGRAQVVPKEDYLVGVDDEHMDKQVIVNLFAQDNYGYDGKCYTDYGALKKCLEYVNTRFSGKKVAIPYMMSCCRGGGDWNLVSGIIAKTLVDCEVILYEYENK